MNSLLYAELRCLVNLLRTRPGRAVLAQLLLPAAVFAALSVQLGSRLGDLAVDPQRAAFLAAALFAPVAAIAFLAASRAAERALFGVAAVDLLLASPAPRGLALMRVALRWTALSVVWGTALCVPFLVVLARRAGSLGCLPVLAPLACLASAAPAVVAALGLALLARQGSAVVRRLARWAGRAFAGSMIAVVIGSAAGVLAAGESTLADRLGSLCRGGPPWPLTLPLGIVRAELGALLLGAGVVLGAAAALVVAGPWHARLCRVSTPVRSVARRRAGWPAGVFASLLRKEIVQVAQPHNLAGAVVTVGLSFLLLHMADLAAVMHPERWLDAHARAASTIAAVPESVRRPLALLGVFVWVAVMALPGSILGAVQSERESWWLLAVSPVGRSTVVAAKLVAATGCLLGHAVVFLAIAAVRLDLGVRDACGFLALTVPFVIAAVAVGLALASLPALARADGGRTTLVVVALIGAVLALAAPGLAVWFALRDGFARDDFGGPLLPAALFAGAFGFAGLCTAAGFAAARRNVGALLGPAA